MSSLLLLTLGITFILHGCKTDQGFEELSAARDSKVAMKSNDSNEFQGFFFLPPMSKSPSYSGVFDAKLSPVVEICELPECTPPYHATFTRGDAGSEVIRVDLVDQHYIVNWNTKKTGAKAGATYRVTVKLGNKTLGHKDVIVVNNKSEAGQNGANAIVLIAGQTLPIKFRIEKQQAESGLVVMTNGADPLLLTAKKDDKTIEVYGLRDALGVPIQLTDVLIKGQTESDITHYKYDSQKRISQIITSNKVQFLFDWITEQKAAVTVLANDGTTQLNTVIDFSAQTSATLSSTTQKRTVTMRRNLPLKLEYSSIANKSTFSSSAIAAAAATNSTVTINVNRCGVPADVTAMLLVRSVDGGLLAGPFPASKVGTGIYTTTLPTGLAPSVNPSEICEDLALLLKIGCTAQKVGPALCAGISLALLVSGYGTLIAAPVGTACTEALLGMTFICATLGYSGISGGPSLAKQLCDSPGLNRTFTQDIVLIPYAVGINGSLFGVPQRVKVTEPFPALSIVLGFTPNIESLQLNPTAPSAGQNYVANVDVFCVTQGSQVTLKVVGSDGYTDSATYGITSTQSQGTFSLTVPGAETGVQDVVTVEIKLADGTTLTRTASLVFI